MYNLCHLLGMKETEQRMTVFRMKAKRSKAQDNPGQQMGGCQRGRWRESWAQSQQRGFYLVWAAKPLRLGYLNCIGNQNAYKDRKTSWLQNHMEAM